MSLSVQIGLWLAVATALTSIVSFLYKHRGAVAAPAVKFREPVRSSLMLFRSGWYTLGIVIAMGSWGLHAAALGLSSSATPFPPTHSGSWCGCWPSRWSSARRHLRRRRCGRRG
jgi:hypothetical protein